MTDRELPMASPDNSGFGKAIAIVFLLIWTLASAGMSFVFLGVGSSMPSGFGVMPWFMSVVPIGFTAMGIMLLMKVATSKPNSTTNMRAESISHQPFEVPPPVSAPPHCQGCGSRRNPPGSTMCAHCGGALSS